MAHRLSGRDLSLDAPIYDDGTMGRGEDVCGGAPSQDDELAAAQEREIVRSRISDALGRGIRNFKKATSDFGSRDTTSESVAPQAKLNAGAGAVAHSASAAPAEAQKV